MTGGEVVAASGAELLWRVLLVAAGVLTGIVILEGVSRVTYEAPWYDRLVAEQQRNQEHKYRSNADGLRDEDYPPIKPANYRRVLVLGDSFTFGSGVLDDDAVFPEIIEKQLNERVALLGVQHVDVLNGGIPGSLTKDWVKLWQRLADRFEPDVVLIVFFLRDGTHTGSINGFFDPIRDKIVSRNRQSISYRYSYFYRLLRDRWDRSEVAGEYTKEFQTAYFGNAEQTSEWLEAQHNLLTIKRFAQQKSATVGLAVFPVLVELDDRYPFRAICDLIVNFAQTNDLPAYNLLEAFGGQHDADLWVSAYDQHPNARAHAIAAHYLLPFVRQLLEQHESQKSALLSRPGISLKGR